MKFGSVIAGIGMVVQCLPAAWAEPTCEYTDLDCRTQYIHDNLPTEYKPAKPTRVLDPAAEHSPDDAARERIDAALKDARGMDAELAKARIKLAGADSGFTFDWTSADSWQRRYRQEKERKPAEVAAALKAYNELLGKQSEAYDRAIAGVIELYHLVPKTTAFEENPNAPVHDRVNDWFPHFGARQHYDFQSHLWVQDVRPRIQALTRQSDGTIVLLDSSFASAASIAENVLHETVHWLDRVAMNRRLVGVQSDRSEELAYGVVLERKTSLGISADRVREVKYMQSKFRGWAEHPETRDSDPESQLYDVGPADVVAPVSDLERAGDIAAVIEEGVARNKEAAEKLRADGPRPDCCGKLKSVTSG